MQQHRVTSIAANQDRKDSDSPSQDPCQVDGSTISAFPEETGYGMVFFPDMSVFGELNLEQKWDYFTYNYLKIVFLGPAPWLSD